MGNIISVFNFLNSNGINLLSIIIIIGLVHIIKTGLNFFSFYNEKTKSIINILLGLLLSIALSFLFFKINDFKLIIINSITGAGLSVYSREIIDAIIKIFKNKTGT